MPLAFRTTIAVIFISLVLTSGIPTAVSCQELPLTHYKQDSEVNPLPSADVRSLYQDRLGYVWIVVYSSGLVRYDGNTFDRYASDDGLPDLAVRQVLEDQAGRLWVASNAGLVVSEKPLAEYQPNERIRFVAKLASTEFVKTTIIQNRLAIDVRGILWIGTREDGLIRYHFRGTDSMVVDTLRTDVYGEGKNKDIRSVAVRGDGSVWVGLGGGDLLMFKSENSSYKLYSSSAGLPKFSSDVFFESRDGKFYGGCRNGMVWRLVEGEEGNHFEIISDELTKSITSMMTAPDSVLWITSDGSGILKISDSNDTLQQRQHPATRTLYTKRNGLLSDNVSDLMEDREHNIWIAQLTGVSKLRSNFGAFKNYTAKSYTGERPVLPNPSINAVLPGVSLAIPEGTWAGTSGGGLTLMNADTLVGIIQTTDGLRNDWVNSVVRDEHGRIWVGTASGMNCISFNPDAPPPFSRQVHKMTFDGRSAIIGNYQTPTIFSCKSLSLPVDSGSTKTVEALWFPGFQNLYCFVENQWFVFRNNCGLPFTFFHAVEVDSAGRLYVGTRDRGLYRSTRPIDLAYLRQLQTQDIPDQLSAKPAIFGKEIVAPLFERIWSIEDGAPTNQIESIVWLNGDLWVGTLDGLAVLEGSPTRMTTLLKTRDGLPANNATSIVYDKERSSLWIGTNGGLAEVDPRLRRVVRVVTKANGLVENEVWSYGSTALGRDGTVIFGTSRGLSFYLPEFDKPNPVIPVPRFQQAEFRQDADGDNEVSFEYAAISFADENLVRYKTRLVGYDKTWSPEKTDVKIRYTNLPAFFLAKSYTFEVLASNNSGVWTDTPLTFSFDVQPPWWFRWWWLVTNILMLGIVIYAFSRYRMRQLEQRSRVLEQTVEERTHEIRIKAEEISRQSSELSHKNKELEDKNQEIVRTQEQLIMQEKLASLGALTAGIAHEIKNPLNFVNNFAELSTELIQELREDIESQKNSLDTKMMSRVMDNLQDLEHNATKINEHGKRADSIVRGMLLHSRGKSGERLLTNLNMLLDEYVNLAYHGLRALDTSFNITIKTEYDPTIGEINVVPQDLSRVFLNIVNNACYAANERKKNSPDSFAPTLWVTSKNLGNQIEVRIRDNGTGIPKHIIDRVFEPFFTTKPTGKGTGLGLSLSYEIVVKGHKGDLKIDSKEGEYTEFIIRLPKQFT